MRNHLLVSLTMACATTLLSQQAMKTSSSTARQEGPCDIYGTTGTPCVAAHSTTRALYASYNGPLYQVKRQSDDKMLDVGTTRSATSQGFADAEAQDVFCAKTLCVITRIYDQSGQGNHLDQAGPGTFRGPAKGAFDTLPIADMAPITIGGNKAYGVYMIPGMGFRNNNATGLAIDDEPEGIYYVIDGTHFDSGCCFDYGNSSTNGRAVGTGTMETTYFGTSTVWGRGKGPGPWIMSDMEAGLFSGQGAKENVANPTIDSWRFVTAVMDGGGGDRWDLRGGNAQKGNLTTFYSGVRPSPNRSGGYYPMHKKGGILLGTGGDNGNGSSGTFYEGVMTTGFPTEATTDAVQSNIIAAHYDIQRIRLSRITTFTPRSTQDVTVTFTNTSATPATRVKLALDLPNKQWSSLAGGTDGPTQSFGQPVPPGASLSATFKVTSSPNVGSGFLIGKVEWMDFVSNEHRSETIASRLRNVFPVKINEVRFGTRDNTGDQFIELYNPSDVPIDISNWSLIHTPSQWASGKVATIPPSTILNSHAFYLLGLSSTGLVSPTAAGDRIINVRSTVGLDVGQKIDIEGETRTIAELGTPAEAMTTLFIPVSTGPWLTVSAGSSNLPVTNAAGFAVGQRMSIESGGNFELATVTSVGKGSTQTVLTTTASVGTTMIKLASASNLSIGDELTIGTGAHKEIVKVAAVASPDSGETSVTLGAPLRFEHMADVDVASPGTGISFSPATKFPHTSGEAVQALGSGVTLDRPLSHAHLWGASVRNAQAAAVGYQGTPAPNQWFGASLSNPTVQPNPAGPLANNAGSIALLDVSGNVVDAIVYGTQQSNSSGNGTITSPELATLEGDQSKGGCIVVAPAMISGQGVSVGRFPDGADTDSNCTDFLSPAAATLAVSSTTGEDNIKVTNVVGFEADQPITIDSNQNAETSIIATVGTAGATTLAASTDVGVNVITVSNISGFAPDQAITIDSGSNSETATITRLTRRGTVAITLASQLSHSHASGAAVFGSGITLKKKLERAHSEGISVFAEKPTPGASNRY